MKPVTLEIYRDRKREWRWRMKRCGRIVADSGEGYKRRSGAVKAAASLMAGLQLSVYRSPAK